MKRILITALAAILALILAACGSGDSASSDGSTGTIDNAKDMFKAAQQAMEDKNTMHVNTDLDMNMTMDMSAMKGASALGDDTTYETCFSRI